MEGKPVIVLLPGLNGTEGLFQPLIDQNKEGYEILTIAFPTEKKLSYLQLKQLVLEKLDALKKPYILLGESFSGPLALFIAQSHPGNLVGVILVASFVGSPNYRIGKYLPWRLGFDLVKPVYKIRALLSGKRHRALVSAISTELQKVKSVVLADRISSIFNVVARKALSDCKVPVMYFKATKDCVVPKRNLAEIQAIKPDVAVASFKTGHFLLQSMPVEAWREIVAFAKKI